MIAALFARLFSPLGTVLAAISAAAALIALFAADQRSIGAAKLKVKTEKANAAVQVKSDAAAARSRDVGARGVRDPYTRAD
jgi:hypothetical protein